MYLLLLFVESTGVTQHLASAKFSKDTDPSLIETSKDSQDPALAETWKNTPGLSSAELSKATSSSSVKTSKDLPEEPDESVSLSEEEKKLVRKLCFLSSQYWL